MFETFILLPLLLTSALGANFEFVKLNENGVSSHCLLSSQGTVTVQESIDPPIQLGDQSSHNPMISRNGKIYLPNYEGPDQPSSSFSYSTYKNIIAPFWQSSFIDIDGHVCYEIHDSNSYTWDYSKSANLQNKVGTFLRSSLGLSVFVQSLLVVEWKHMTSSGHHDKTNTFQALIAVTTHGSYAVYTYKCGEIQWSSRSTVIGFNARYGMYRNHPFSHNSSVPNPIACVNRPESLWSNVVYKIDGLDSGCYYNTFGCTNGDCVSTSSVCNGRFDCRDKSDEIACSPGVKCPPDQFGCNNGDCIDSSHHCDGVRQCRDGSDELNCSSLSVGSIAGIVVVAMVIVFLLVSVMICVVAMQIKQRNRRLAQFQVLRESMQSQTTPTTQSLHFHPKPDEWYYTVEGAWVQGPPPSYAPPPQEVELVEVGDQQPLIESEDPPANQAPAAQLPSPVSQQTIELLTNEPINTTPHDPSNEVGVVNDEGNTPELTSSDSFDNETAQLLVES